jgi:hypothetical protein
MQKKTYLEVDGIFIHFDESKQKFIVNEQEFRIAADAIEYIKTDLFKNPRQTYTDKVLGECGKQ